MEYILSDVSVFSSVCGRYMLILIFLSINVIG